MSARSSHIARAARAVASRGARGELVRATNATQTGTTTRRVDRTEDDDLRMFGELSPELRTAMETVARGSLDANSALPHIITLLVDGGSDRKRDAIVDAIRMNDPLREQWERTWEILRR